MATLIMTVIAIVLVIALTIATIFYGGNIFKESGSDVEVAQLMAQGQQIRAAIKLYKNEHSRVPANLELLVSEGYLNSLPEGGWVQANNSLLRPDIEFDQCLRVNRMRGVDEVLACDDPNISDNHLCCVMN